MCVKTYVCICLRGQLADSKSAWIWFQDGKKKKPEVTELQDELIISQILTSKVQNIQVAFSRHWLSLTQAEVKKKMLVVVDRINRIQKLNFSKC